MTGLRKTLLVGAAAALAAYLVALLFVAAYYASDSTYATRFTANTLFRAIAQIDGNSLREAFMAWDITLLVGISLVVFAAFLPDKWYGTARALLFLQPVIVPMAILGLFMLVATIAAPAGVLDGEFFGEHWPTTVVQGLWVAFCLLVAVLEPLTRTSSVRLPNSR